MGDCSTRNSLAYIVLCHILQELKAAVKRAEADRTLAQQGLHELQLQMREAFASRGSTRNERLAPQDANVHGLISAMEEQGIGGPSLPPRLLSLEHASTDVWACAHTM